MIPVAVLETVVVVVVVTMVGAAAVVLEILSLDVIAKVESTFGSDVTRVAVFVGVVISSACSFCFSTVVTLGVV